MCDDSGLELEQELQHRGRLHHGHGGYGLHRFVRLRQYGDQHLCARAVWRGRCVHHPRRRLSRASPDIIDCVNGTCTACDTPGPNGGCTSSDASCVDLEPSMFDTSCTTSADCVTVTLGELCDSECLCGGSAIERRGPGQVQSARRGRPVGGAVRLPGPWFAGLRGRPVHRLLGGCSAQRSVSGRWAVASSQLVSGLPCASHWYIAAQPDWTFVATGAAQVGLQQSCIVVVP